MSDNDEQLVETAMAAVSAARRELSRAQVGEELVRELWGQSLGLDVAPGATPPCTTELIARTTDLRSTDGITLVSWTAAVWFCVGVGAGIVIGGLL